MNQVGGAEDGIDLLERLITVGIPALMTAIVAIVGAWLAYRQAKANSETARRQDAQDEKIAELEAEIVALKSERDDTKELLRSAIHHIRDWLRWSVEMVAFVRQHAPGETPPEPPALPANLESEV